MSSTPRASRLPPRIATSAWKIWALVATLAVGACATHNLRADRLFEAGRFAEAETAYLDLLAGKQAEGKRREHFLYRLGLIYALPASSRYDPVKAERYLQELLDREPQRAYAVQASLVLALQVQTNQLRQVLAEETERARLLRLDLERLQSKAARVESEATDQENRGKRLASEIARLRQQIDQLSSELSERERELERIKQIDLEGPP